MTEQVNFFKYLGHSISVHKLNINLEENTQKNSKLNGVIIRHFQRRYEIRNIIYNVQFVSKSSPYVWWSAIGAKMPRQEMDRNKMKFLRLIFGVTFQDKTRSEDI
jgi:hypothetical protein